LKKSLSRYFEIAILPLCMALLVLKPQISAEAVKKALFTCWDVILPSLLPFFFISGLISSLGIPQFLAHAAQKPLKKLFSMSGWACAPLLLGLLGGYPVGASSIAQLRSEGRLSQREAERLLPVCNNTGPAFIIGAVGGGIFSSPAAGAMLYGAHIVSALILALLFSPGKAGEAEIPPPDNSCPGIIEALPGSIGSAVEKSLQICGFVIFFSILSSLLEELGILSTSALLLSRFIGLEIGFCRCLLSGILELGGGIASMSGIELLPTNLALAAFILGFGSLSVHCQTLAVVSRANIKCARHFAGRIIHGVLSAIIVLASAYLFRI